MEVTPVPTNITTTPHVHEDVRKTHSDEQMQDENVNSQDEEAKTNENDKEQSATKATDIFGKIKEDEGEATKLETAQVEPQKIESPSLQLNFRDPSGAETYVVSFSTRPLGLDMDEHVKPVKITKVFGAAKQLGVQVGSELIGISGTDVQHMGYPEMLKILQGKIAPLPPDGVVTLFRDTSGAEQSIVFPTKPLGISFDEDSKPIKITAVSDAAHSLGVGVGFEITSIAGTNVEQMEFANFLELLKSKVSSLPSRE